MVRKVVIKLIILRTTITMIRIMMLAYTHIFAKKLIICHQCSYGQIMTQGKYFKSLEIEGSFLFDD